MSLNTRQETFCQLKAIGNISDSEAYRQAGYSHKNPDSNAAQLVVKKGIKARIAELKAKWAEKLEITREGQVRKLEKAQRLALETCDTSSYIRAIEGQSKHFGLMADKLITEDSAEQKALTAKQAAANRQAAKVALRLHRSDQDGQEGQKAG
jgi:hypothetical protein